MNFFVGVVSELPGWEGHGVRRGPTRLLADLPDQGRPASKGIALRSGPALAVLSLEGAA